MDCWYLLEQHQYFLVTIFKSDHLKLLGNTSGVDAENSNIRISLPFKKYISNAAYKLINCPFLLCFICSPSNSVLNKSALLVTAPVNSIFSCVVY